MSRISLINLIAAMVFMLAGCARTVEVRPMFPEPVLEPYPLDVGIRYPEDQENFTHKEDPQLEPEWTIRLGAANREMLQTVFDKMFRGTVELTADSTTNNDQLDLIIEPRLEELEFEVPHQSGTDQYVVWLRYTMMLETPDSGHLGDWKITGYGQEDEGRMGLGAKEAMREATITALRDAAANIIVDFLNAPGISDQVLLTRGDAEGEKDHSDNLQ